VKSRTDTIDTLEVTTAPLHVFADLELLLSRTGISAFVDEILSSSTDNAEPGDVSRHEGDQPNSESEDVSTPPTTPGVLDKKAREKERLRLERLVLRDMEVDEDYPQKTSVKGTTKSGRKVLHQCLVFHVLTCDIISF
jgi:autophagy-related protein 2